MRFSPAFLVLALLLSGCGSKGAVSLLAQVEQPSVRVVDGAAGTSLSGGFVLSLALGSEAPGSTRVELGNFSLQTEAGAPLVEVLNLSSAPQLPLDLAKGDTRTVNFTFDEDSVDRNAVCAGKVRIVGAVIDSLKGATDPVSSAPFTPDCGAT